MRNYTKFSHLSIADELAIYTWENELNRRSSIINWCKRIQNKIVNCEQSLNSVHSFPLPLDFKHNGKDKVIWQNQIEKWCQQHNCSVKVQRTYNDFEINSTYAVIISQN